MKKQNLSAYLTLLATPVLLMLLGLLLLIHPDFASAALARVLGWGLSLAGVAFAISTAVRPEMAVGRAVAALMLLVFGIWLLRNPLLLAAGIGRFLGLVLMLRGIGDLVQTRGRAGSWGLVTAVLGLVLVALPMTASRLAFSLCGGAMLAIGFLMLVFRLRTRRLLPEDNPERLEEI